MKILAILFLVLGILCVHQAQAAYVNVESCGSGQGSDLFSDLANCEASTKSACTEFKGGSCKEYEIFEDAVTGRKALKISVTKQQELEAKESAKEAKEKADKDAKKAICDEVAAAKKSDITSNAKMVDLYFKHMECLK